MLSIPKLPNFRPGDEEEFPGKGAAALRGEVRVFLPSFRLKAERRFEPTWAALKTRRAS
jgi:hypothetical protein